MADHVEGPLYYERMGRTGPVMAFVHPNPMDQSCWIFQMAHLSTWYRCIASTSPVMADRPRRSRASPCPIWRGVLGGVDDAARRDARSWSAARSARDRCRICTISVRGKRRRWCCQARATRRARNSPKRIGLYEDGIDIRWDFTFEDLSPAFQPTPLAHYFARPVYRTQRYADLQSIVYQFQALAIPDPPDHFEHRLSHDILTGTEDGAHLARRALKARIPDCEMKILPAPAMPARWSSRLFDRFMIEFLKDHGLFPGA